MKVPHRPTIALLAAGLTTASVLLSACGCSGGSASASQSVSGKPISQLLGQAKSEGTVE